LNNFDFLDGQNGFLDPKTAADSALMRCPGVSDQTIHSGCLGSLAIERHGAIGDTRANLLALTIRFQ
jgi:hypothetical protein